MGLKDLLAPFAVWKRIFEKPYTIKKPIDQRPGAARYRGFHKNDLTTCIGCGTCETICQNNAIDLVPVEEIVPGKEDSGLRPRVDYGRCCYCALCVDICTTSSLTMSNEYIWIDTDPDNFRFIPGKDSKPWNNESLGYSRSDRYGLLNPQRENMDMLSGDQSVKSFLEMVKGYSREQAEQEADRCVECGLCIAACPAHMDIPGYIKAVREGDIKEGLRLLYETNPFPEACGRVCTHRCETACAIGKQGEALAIRWLKRYLADQVELGDYEKYLGKSEIKENGKKAAVIGAGPGGLSAAYYLRQLGYSVTVFEAAPRAGGMLRYGIPEYRLPYDMLDKDINYILSLGVELKTGIQVGKELILQELYDQYDVLYLSTGLPSPYSLGIEGEKHKRVVAGLDILRDITEGKDPGLGKKVAVIGGGNVAMDAARSARRLGARVTILYRRREEDMPADIEEIEEAKEEGVIFITQAIPVKVVDGIKEQVGFTWGKARMVDQGPGKRPKPELIEDQIETTEFDTIITAIGQGTDLDFIPENFSQKLEFQRYKLKVDEAGRTSSAKIFAGGDMVNSTKDAISAIADGHRSALAIDEFLQKKQH